MVSDKPACRGCRYWVPVERGILYDDDMDYVMRNEEDETIVVGECRRFPPVTCVVSLANDIKDELARGIKRTHASVTQRGLASQWPLVFDSEWCGEHSAAPPSP
jgi:hypothetical protein